MNLACPVCQELLDVPEELAGRSIRCGVCSGVLQVPRSQPAIIPAPARWPSERPAADETTTLRQLPEPRELPAPRRGLAFALVFLVLLLLGPCAGISVFLVAEWGYPAFLETTDPNGGFYQVSFPGPAAPFTQMTSNGGVVRGVQMSRDFPPERYFVGHIDLPPVAGQKGVEEALDLAAIDTTELVPPGVEELARMPGRHDSYPCRDWYFADQDVQLVVRCIVVDGAIARRIYVIGWEGPGPRGPEEYRVRRFFRSFRILRSN